MAKTAQRNRLAARDAFGIDDGEDASPLVDEGRRTDADRLPRRPAAIGGGRLARGQEAEADKDPTNAGRETARRQRDEMKSIQEANLAHPLFSRMDFDRALTAIKLPKYLPSPGPALEQPPVRTAPQIVWVGARARGQGCLDEFASGGLPKADTA